MIKAILINPFKKEISLIKVRPNLETYYTLLDCESIELISLPDGINSIYVDEDGIRNQSSRFIFNGITNHIFGKALVISVDKEGNDISCQCEILKLAKNIKWL